MAKTNQLAQETSPYLQQHMHNPVDWYAWNDATLAKAKKENKPILLSIGYAACHWCHVMAHESFEDEETAAIMNQLFINIKVDREERPDLDKVYQTAHYLLTQRSGGWPLTIFLSPDDLIPFFSGTYFPKESRYQLPAFKEVLHGIADYYKKNPEEIKKQNTNLMNFLQREQPSLSVSLLTDEPIKIALELLEQKFDTTYGGLKGAPKFPNPPIIEFLLQENSPMAFITLEKMAAGGIYDQLQGGFFRYTVDEKWEIPHFEKMLYDNAQLLFLYAYASKKLAQQHFADIARETANWTIDKMQSPEGGYYSSLNADSEGQEGKFYIWDSAEIKKILSAEEFQFAETYFNLKEKPNFENQWHLTVSQLNKEDKKLLSIVKQKLLTVRDKRISPSCDDKILTAWNALMIKAMAVAGDVLQERRYMESAERALHLIQKKLMVNNSLMATYKDNKAHLPAYLDDYAFLLDAVMTLFRISKDKKYLPFAQTLADNLLMHFFDKEKGGFFFTADNHEKILYRSKTMQDEAIPSGNAIAAGALLQLGRELNEPRYVNAVENTLQTAWSSLSHYPSLHCGLLIVLKNYLSPFCTDTVCE